jgi:hypothetical protein
MVLDSMPNGPALARPELATSTMKIEASPFQLWRMTLSIRLSKSDPNVGTGEIATQWISPDGSLEMSSLMGATHNQLIASAGRHRWGSWHRSQARLTASHRAGTGRSSISLRDGGTPPGCPVPCSVDSPPCAAAGAIKRWVEALAE